MIKCVDPVHVRRRYCPIFLSSAPEVSTIEASLVREVQAIECWLRLISLFINVTKTEVMLFGTSQRLAKIDQFSVSVNGSAIKRVTEFKYLGVIFDEHLS